MLKKSLLFLFPIFAMATAAIGQSNILEDVKQNPDEAIALCNRFRDLNSQGISASSNNVIKEISTKKNLNFKDAEILSIYVIGLHCPEVN
tara:strand:- start:171 stop:440 length:270 start_codon:yes stop_codon:yes gene_type:complete